MMLTLNKITTPILFLLSVSANAQSVSTLMGGRSAGVAHASATLHDEWSLLNNVGGLSKANEPNASFAYEVPAGLPGANRMAAIVSGPVKTGAAGLGVFRFGDDVYHEQVISVGYANQFGLASLGLKLNYVEYLAAGFGVRRAFSLSAGGIAQLSPQISIGAYIVNLNQPRLSSADNERLPTQLAAGISFQPAAKLLLLLEIEKSLAYPATIKGAIEYVLYKKLTFRTGFALPPGTAFFGIGYQAKKLKIDYAFQYNGTVGAAHQISVVSQLLRQRKSHAD